MPHHKDKKQTEASEPAAAAAATGVGADAKESFFEKQADKVAAHEQKHEAKVAAAEDAREAKHEAREERFEAKHPEKAAAIAAKEQAKKPQVPSGSAVIEVNNLVKHFGSVVALGGISFSVHQGEVFGFIGNNGAGKSTTIRTLLGLLKATSGEAKVFGLDAWKDPVKIHRSLAYVPGDVNLWPNLTGGEVIDLFVSLRGGKAQSSQVRKRRNELIEKFELDPTKQCRTYSKGNRQKVVLISAFASDVDLYLLDEPTSGLDPIMEQVFQECIRGEKQAGKTIFLSSHIMQEVRDLADRVAVIRQGLLVKDGAETEAAIAEMEAEAKRYAESVA